jgi:hypothetical protein
MTSQDIEYSEMTKACLVDRLKQNLVSNRSSFSYPEKKFHGNRDESGVHPDFEGPNPDYSYDHKITLQSRDRKQRFLK